MTKNFKKLLSVFYFLFTFLAGILLAVYLPYVLMYNSAVTSIARALNDGDGSAAVSMEMTFFGGYYEETPSVSEDCDGVKLLMYPCAALTAAREDGTDSIRPSYILFLFGDLDDFKTAKSEGNKAVLSVTDLDGNEHLVSILDLDADSDGKNDTASTVEENSFLAVELPKEECSSVASLSFLDRDGNIFASFASLSLSYSEAFFADVAQFISVYNEGYDPENSDALKARADRLTEAENALLTDAHPTYKRNVSSIDYKNEASNRATLIVVIYFIAVYILFDLTLGFRFIIRFVKWILKTVFRVKFKEKAASPEDFVFGKDHYVKLRVSADLTDAPDLQTAIAVRYSNEQSGFDISLLQENGFVSEIRVKAGLYVNPWVDLEEGYRAENVPEKLVLDGFTYSFVIKVTKK